MNESDLELLQRFAREGVQEAFAALVERHAGLVYAVAKRVVATGALAEEVTQSVFVDLAKAASCAAGYDDAVPVVAWLCTVARRTAIDALRKETRRTAREQVAQEILEADMSMNKSSAGSDEQAEWAAVEPLLGEVLEALPVKERSAVWLRFFEGKGLREVGAELGISEDAAQKRVTRALEQLRELLGKRGVKLTSAGLATGLTAQAATLAIAPVGLAAEITAAVGGLAVPVSATVVAGAKIFMMTTMQKMVLAGVAAAVVGLGVHEWLAVQSLRAQAMEREKQSAWLGAQVKRLAGESEAKREALADTEAAIDKMLAPKTTPSLDDTKLEAEMLAWLGRVDRLRKHFREHPEQAVPEMKNLADVKWLDVVQSLELADTKQLRRATASIRREAISAQIWGFQRMLRKYEKMNPEGRPQSVAELADYADEPLSEELLARYELFKVEPTPKNQRGIGVQLAVIVDVEFDTIPQTSSTSSGIHRPAMTKNVEYAQAAFAAANKGAVAKRAEELLPYLRWPTELEVLRLHLEKSASRKP